MKKEVFLSFLVISIFSSCASKDKKPAPKLSYNRAHSMTGGFIQAVDTLGDIVWQQPTQLPVFRVDQLSNGNTVFAETGKGGGGTLWCITPEGKVLWKEEIHAWVMGIDLADNILVNGGRPREYFSRVYSPSGDILWEYFGENISLLKNTRGEYIIPSGTGH